MEYPVPLQRSDGGVGQGRGRVGEGRAEEGRPAAGGLLPWPPTAAGGRPRRPRGAAAATSPPLPRSQVPDALPHVRHGRAGLGRRGPTDVFAIINVPAFMALHVS